MVEKKGRNVQDSRQTGRFLRVTASHGYPDRGQPLLALKDSVKAAKTHDKIVTHVFSHGKRDFSGAFFKYCRERFSRGLLIMEMLPKPMENDQLGKILLGWDSYQAWRATVTPEERESTYRNWARKTQVRIMPDD